MTPDEVLQTPVERFWVMERNIRRIEATSNLDRLNIQAAGQSKDGYNDLHRRFSFEIGVVTQEQPKLDRKGLDSLKDIQQGPVK